LGPVYEEQWGEKQSLVDFFDMKADVEAILRLSGHESEVTFLRAMHPALHPGQTAEIKLKNKHLGWIGLLHPRMEKELGFETRVFLFELDLAGLLERDIPTFKALSKFPSVRRDLAVIVAESVAVGDMIRHLDSRSLPLIQQIVVFDVYQGPGVEQGRKSVALGFILQDDTGTLTDERVSEVIASVLDILEQKFNAMLRD